jgi:hypothetical protein
MDYSHTVFSLYIFALQMLFGIEAIAVKFELTGGFIKNAVLSALLSAISRDFGGTRRRLSDSGAGGVAGIDIDRVIAGTVLNLK